MDALHTNKNSFDFSLPSFFVSSLSIEEIKSEVLRKLLHFSIALTPILASFNRPLMMGFLAAGTLFYTFVESLRMAGVEVPVISKITVKGSRSRDRGRFVLGPVTLGIGAMLALLIYPSPVASVAIYSLAFGDGFASLIGRIFGNIRPAFLKGKSLEGSLACFFAVYISAFLVLQNSQAALIAALTATSVEALPLEDYDNILLPVTVGLVVQFCLTLM
jgi:dolichol kinase